MPASSSGGLVAQQSRHAPASGPACVAQLGVVPASPAPLSDALPLLDVVPLLEPLLLDVLPSWPASTGLLLGLLLLQPFM
jgi:hypothetical protein